MPNAALRPIVRRFTVAAVVLIGCMGLPPAAAQDTGAPMSGEEFEAYTTGKTLTFGVGGRPYGVEQYLENRRVIWAFIGEECREGRWFEAGEMICFSYDDDPARLHCWEFYDSEAGLLARIRNGSGATELVEVEQSPAPLHCPGPRVGA
jgi:hypothetical protein